VQNLLPRTERTSPVELDVAAIKRHTLLAEKNNSTTPNLERLRDNRVERVKQPNHLKTADAENYLEKNYPLEEWVNVFSAMEPILSTFDAEAKANRQGQLRKLQRRQTSP
jgi:hypothetical protein